MILAPPIWQPRLWLPWLDPLASFASTGKLQRDPSTGKVQRQPSSGKAVRADDSNPACCCGGCWDKAFLDAHSSLHFTYSGVQIDSACESMGVDTSGIPDSAKVVESEINTVWTVPRTDHTADRNRFSVAGTAGHHFAAQNMYTFTGTCAGTPFSIQDMALHCVVGKIINAFGTVIYDPGWWVLVWGGGSAENGKYSGCAFWAEGSGCLPANTAIPNRITTSGATGPQARGEWPHGGGGAVGWFDFGFLGSLTISL